MKKIILTAALLLLATAAQADHLVVTPDGSQYMVLDSGVVHQLYKAPSYGPTPCYPGMPGTYRKK